MSDRPQLRLAIGLPWQNQVDAVFCRSLAEMMGMLGATLDGIGEVKLFEINGTYIDRSRAEIVRGAVLWGATHILWLDSDMLFPPDTAHRLLKRNVDIVGVNYAGRRFPHHPVTFKTLPELHDESKATKCYTYEDSTGLEEVAAIGFGVVLTRINIFEKIVPEDFRTGPDPDKGIYVGEDVSFCLAAHRHGYKVYVDHDLSHEIGHRGTECYMNTISVKVKEKAEALEALEAAAKQPKIELVGA